MESWGRLMLVLLGIGLLGGCQIPGNPNVNVAHDPANPATFNAFQSEQSIVRTVLPDGSRMLVMGYQDSTSQTTMGSDGRPAFIPNYSLMGLSTSMDDGTSWFRQPQFATPPGLTALRGDPWLATNGSEVWYVFLGGTGVPDAVTGAVSPNSIAYAHSSTGGLFWDPIEWVQRPYPIDKCSVAVSDDGWDVYVAYVNTNTRLVEVLVSNDAGGSWNVRLIPPSFPMETHQNPIVHVVPGSMNESYIAYQVARQGAQHVAVARSTDDGGVFTVVNDQVDPMGILPALFLNAANGLRIQNFVFQHFAIQPGSGQLFVAYEDRSTIYVQSSPDGVVWSSPVVVTPPSTRRQFQPSIAASEARIGVLFYEQGSAVSADRAQTVVIGASSSDGVSWVSDVVSLTPPAGAVPFEPCPTGTGASPGYFGDYVGLVPLARPGDQSPNLLFFGAWADSRDGCLATDRFMAIHHHTVGTRFL